MYSLCELLEAPVHIILIESCVLWRKGPGGTHARRQKNKQTQRVRLGTKYVIVTHITPSPGRNKIKEITGCDPLDCHLYLRHFSAAAAGWIQRSPSVTDKIVKTHQRAAADRLNYPPYLPAWASTHEKNFPSESVEEKRASSSERRAANWSSGTWNAGETEQKWPLILPQGVLMMRAATDNQRQGTTRKPPPSYFSFHSLGAS